MATTKTRINISVSRRVRDTLELLAKRDEQPLATKAERLLEEALELEEDVALARILDARDRKGAKFISHEKAWCHLSK